MHPSPLFITAGLAASCVALYTAARGLRQRSSQRLPSLLWACFGIGMLLHGFAPNLPIEHNAFVIPSHNGPIAGLSPIELVERERTMKLYAGLFTLAGGLGLAVRYRNVYAPRRRPSAALAESPHPIVAS